MILRGARVALSADRASKVDITIRGGRIAKISREDDGIDLTGYLILPGLINAHDHLSFNLFPLLGRPPYPNATEWARDIYHPDESPVREHRSVPRPARLAWGALKNLVSGVTTVAHHDPDPAEMLRTLPIRVAKAAWGHSLAFTPDLIARRKRSRGVFVVHAGEGIDAQSRDEIVALEKMGVLDERMVIVHGVAFDAAGLKLMKRRGASLIACPVSNLFTLRKTLRRSVFAAGIPIALGTDSALTAPGDLLDALRAAKSVWRLSASRLYSMVTTTAARILRLDDGRGEIREGGAADMIVMRDPGGTPAQALLDLRKVELVIVRGKIKLVSNRFKNLAADSFERVAIAERGDSFVDVPVRAIAHEAVARLGSGFRLAGRRVRIK